MEENTQQSRRGSVNRTEASGKRFTPSQRTVNTPLSMSNLLAKSSNPTAEETENAVLAAGILTSTVSTLIKAGYVRAGKNQNGEIVLIFPSTVWDGSLRLK